MTTLFPLPEALFPPQNLLILVKEEHEQGSRPV